MPFCLKPRDAAWKTLTLRQKIGQTMMVIPDREFELRAGNGSLKRFFEKYPVTGFFMNMKLFHGVKEADKLEHPLAARIGREELVGAESRSALGRKGSRFPSAVLKTGLD
jgi:hypothetical protein